MNYIFEKFKRILRVFCKITENFCVKMIKFESNVAQVSVQVALWP